MEWESLPLESIDPDEIAMAALAMMMVMMVPLQLWLTASIIDLPNVVVFHDERIVSTNVLVN